MKTTAAKFECWTGKFTHLVLGSAAEVARQNASPPKSPLTSARILRTQPLAQRSEDPISPPNYKANQLKAKQLLVTNGSVPLPPDGSMSRTHSNQWHEAVQLRP